MRTLVLLRHGESQWNKENRFTGWTDVDLSERGVSEARDAGQILLAEGYKFDIVFTSYLKRAIRTMEIALSEMGEEQKQVDIKKSWRLNEKHYGVLQGLNKTETAEKYGEEQLVLWRRSYDVSPPPLDENDPRYPGKDPLYKDLKKEDIPRTECLKDTVARFVTYWNSDIAPELRNGKNVLIVAHGNSLRALVKYLDNLSDKDILKLNIPTGIPLVYELTDDLKPLQSYYLGDPDRVNEAINAVKEQGHH